MSKLKVLLTAIIAALTLGLSVSAANANRSITASPAGAITGTSQVTFSSPESEATIISLVTLRGIHESAIGKVRNLGARVGVITDCRIEGERVEGAPEGTAVRVTCPLVAEREWKLFYNSFTGTLPRIATVLVDVNDVGFLIEARAFGILVWGCLYGTRAGAIASERRGGQTFDQLVIQSERAVEIVRILLENRFPAFTRCPRRGFLTGTFNITPVQRMGLI